jgi:NADH:ubiquinone oxidoreductase subunit 5 (subunit L)/multisubunit Na+/H+ antiporter MnhA subunit
LCAGAIQHSTDTKDIEKLGGLIKKIPLTAFLTLCFSLAISAIVPFNGFVSEWLLYQSLFKSIGISDTFINIIAMLAIAALAMAGALAAVCFVKFFGIAFLGRPRTHNAINAKKVPITMNISMSILAGICLLMGILPMFFVKVIDRVILGISGESIIGKLNGNMFIICKDLSVSTNAISPLGMLILMGVVIVMVIIVIRIVGGKYIERKYGTWDCGFESLNSRMQYTATGFSKPIRIVLKILYRPKRIFEISKSEYKYHPESIKYSVSVESVFEQYLYRPALNIVKHFSRKLKFSIQTGSVHTYLLYIFITIVVVMLYNRFI